MESFRQIKNNNVDLISNNDPLDKNRLLIEDLWESVLREECPDDQAERLIQLKELSYSKQIDGDSSKTFKNEIVDIVNSMDLAESIAAARAFSLYFQLVNILEQRVEEDRYIQSFTNKDVQKSPDNLDPFAPALARQNAPVTFRELFYRLRKLNVPPGKLEALLQEMDIRLVFTAHPTEIVRHTIRHKQTRVANLLKKIQIEQFLTKEEKISKEEINHRVNEILNLLELNGLEKRKINEISGGQQQRVALARCLVKKPKLLLLDEPLAALDKQLRVQTQFELVNLQYKLGITFIIVTHDQEEAMSLSDRMAIMKNGEILQVGNPVEIYEKPKDIYIANFIGTANIFNVLNKNNQIIIKELNYEVKNINNKENYVKCLIRPEKISVKKLENQSDNLNIGVIKEVAYLGSYTKYLIEVNGFEFYSFMQNSLVSDNLQIRWDDKVQISFDETSIYFFND